MALKPSQTRYRYARVTVHGQHFPSPDDLGPNDLEWIRLHISELNGVSDEQIKQPHVIEEYDEAAGIWRLLYLDPSSDGTEYD